MGNGVRLSSQEKWARKEKEARVGTLTSLYTLHYSRHTPPSSGKRSATQRKLSSQPRSASRDLQLGDQSHTSSTKRQPPSSGSSTRTSEGGLSKLNATM